MVQLLLPLQPGRLRVWQTRRLWPALASPAASGSTFVSTIVSLKFTPPEIDIEAGTTVIWENRDVVLPRCAQSQGGRPALRIAVYRRPGKSFSFTFDKPGTYPVFCIPHPFMSQTVVVTEKK
ncbi:MAG: plastocyanin/azurin family copper-binding protein [Thermomicrobiales bacterium]